MLCYYLCWTVVIPPIMEEMLKRKKLGIKQAVKSSCILSRYLMTICRIENKSKHHL